MIASAKFEMDRSYFEAMLRDAMRNSHWLDRWKLPIASLLIVLGLLVIAFTRSFVVVGGVLIAIGLFELANFLKRRAFWVRDRLKTREHLKSHCVEIQFFDDGFTQIGPTSSGRVSWEAVSNVRETENSLQLLLGDGVSIYVPKESIFPTGSAADIIRASRRRA